MKKDLLYSNNLSRIYQLLEPGSKVNQDQSDSISSLLSDIISKELTPEQIKNDLKEIKKTILLVEEASLFDSSEEYGEMWKKFNELKDSLEKEIYSNNS